jgi:hypothetical protein
MVIRCPSCGRAGNFPHPFGLTAHTLRCRKCSARFVTVPINADADDRTEMPALEHTPFAGAGTENGMFPIDDFGSRQDAEFRAHTDLSGDSHYELAAISDDVSDSQIDLPAFAAEDLDWDEPQSSLSLNQGGAPEFVRAVPLHQIGPIEAWGRYHFYIALGFGAAALCVMGYFLCRPLVGGTTVSSSTTALIVGCVGTIAFLLLSLATTTLSLLLVDLGRNIRQLMRQADVEPQPTDEQSRPTNAGLSRSAV